MHNEKEEKPLCQAKKKVQASPRVSYFFLQKICSFATPEKILEGKKKTISKSFQ
jgi:hypothetical protein